jgi:uncharacterized surface protein with fasciclin (FAS1) repeats
MMQVILTWGILVIVLQQTMVSVSAQRVDITQTAINNGNFRTLVAALAATNLASVLRGPGPFTVFAPTDAAFSRLPAGTVESLLRPENRARLTQILKYHVVAGSCLSSAQLNAVGLPIGVITFEGKPLGVRRNGSQLQVNNAFVTLADVFATNGVIHVIDQVLIPPAA